MKTRVLALFLSFNLLTSIYATIRPYERIGMSALGSESGITYEEDASDGKDDDGPSGDDDSDAGGSSSGGSSGGSEDTDGGEGGNNSGGSTDGTDSGEGTGVPGGAGDFEPVMPLDIVPMLDDLVPLQPAIGLKQTEYGIRYDRTLRVNIEDVSNDPLDLDLSISIKDGPAAGTAEIGVSGEDKGFLIYTPDRAADAATDYITVRVSNGTEHADVTIAVHIFEPLEPESDRITRSLSEDSSIDIKLSEICPNRRGHELSYSLTGPAKGTAGVSGGTLTYTPDGNYNGDDSVAVEVSYKNSQYGPYSEDPYTAAAFTIDFTVTPEDDSPIAADDGIYRVASNDVLDIPVSELLENDTAVDDAPLVLTGVGGKTSKAQSLELLEADGIVRYKPNPRADGDDSFTYTVIHEGGTLSATATVSVFIEKNNDNHRLELEEEDPVEIYEGGTLVFYFTVTDIDSEDFENDFEVTLTSGNTGVFADGKGTCAIVGQIDDDTCRYKVEWAPEQYANTTDNGPAHIVVLVTDRGAPTLTASARQDVVVIPVNDAPVISGYPDSDVVIDEDGYYDLTFTVYDPDAAAPMTVNSFTISISASDDEVLPASGWMRVAEGTAVIDGHTVQYTYRLLPAPDKHSEDGLTVTITATDKDAHGTDHKSDTAEFKFIVTPVNDDPVANDDRFVTEGVDAPDEDDPKVLDVLENDEDPDGHETLTIISAGDSFDSDTMTGITEYGGTVTIAADGRSITYLSAQDYYGPDGFYYTITDDVGEVTSTAYVTLQVYSVNDKPVMEIDFSWDGHTYVPGNPGYFHGFEDTPMFIRVIVSDVEAGDDSALLDALMLQAGISAGGDPEGVTSFVFVVDQTPAAYALYGLDYSTQHFPNVRYIRYVPADDQHNTPGKFVELSLTLGDGEDEDEFYLNVYIEFVNDNPKATNKTYRFDERKPAEGGTPETPPLFIPIDDNGVLSLMDGHTDVDIKTNGDKVSFDPDAVTAPNHNAVLVPVYELGGIRSEDSSGGGVLVGYNFYAEYHNENTVTFTYGVKDLFGGKGTATVTLICNAVNDRPFIEPIERQTMLEDDENELIVEIEYWDRETAKSALIVTYGSSDPAIVNPEGIRFFTDIADGKTKLGITPLPDANGFVTITVSVSDGRLMFTRDFIVEVIPVPDAPVANPFSLSATAGRLQPLNPIAYGFDADGDEIYIHEVFDVTGYEAEISINKATGTVYFTAPAGYDGAYILEYTIIDETDAVSNRARITITVTAFGTGPMIDGLNAILVESGNTVTVVEETLTVHNVLPGTYRLTANSSNQSVLPDSALVIDGEGNDVSGLSGSTKTFEIKVPPNASGEAIITITLEHNGRKDEIYVPVTIARENAAPVASNHEYTIDEGKSASFDVLQYVTDDIDDKEDLTILRIITHPSHGSVSIDTSGEFHKINYTPPSNYGRSYYNNTVNSSAKLTFVYEVMDTGGKVDTATITITVTSVATPPYANGEYIKFEETRPANQTVVVPRESIIANDGDYDDWNKNDALEKSTMKIVLEGLTCTLLKSNDPVTEENPGAQTTLTLASIGAKIDEDGNLVFDPPEEGWYMFTYSVETQDLRSGSTDWTSSKEGGSYRIATAYIGVVVNNQIPPPRLSSRTYYSNEDQYTDDPRVVDVAAVDVESEDPEVEIGDGESNFGSSSGLINAFNTALYPVAIAEGSIRVVDTKGVLKDFVPETDLTMDDDGKVTLSYRQNEDANGTAYIYWKVSQGTEEAGNYVESNEGTIAIHVYAVNDEPVIGEFEHPDEMYRGDTVTLIVPVTDVDGETPRIRVNSGANDPSVASDLIIPSDQMTVTFIERIGNTFYYEITFKAIDSFSVAEARNKPITINIYANDRVSSDAYSFDVAVLPKNRPPVPKALHTDTILEDTRGEYDAAAWGTDPDGDALNIFIDPEEDSTTGIFFRDAGGSLVPVPADKVGSVLFSDYGDVQIQLRKILFFPARDFYTKTGEYVEIHYRLTDGTNPDALKSEDVGVIKIAITPVNDAPEILGLRDIYYMPEDEPELITFHVRDIDTPFLDEDGKLMPGISLNVSLSKTAAVTSNEYIEDIRIAGITQAVGSDGKEIDGDYIVTIEMEFVRDKHHTNATSDVTPVYITVDDGGKDADNMPNGKREAEFNLKITAVNDPPRPKDFDEISGLDGLYKVVIDEDNNEVSYYIEILEDEVTTIDIVSLFVDPEGMTISIMQLEDFFRGRAANTNNKAVFTPEENFFHDDEAHKDDETELARFAFTVSDPSDAQYDGFVYIFIDPVNDAPETPDFRVSGDEDEPFYINPIENRPAAFPNPVSSSYNRVYDVDNDQDDLKITKFEILPSSKGVASKGKVIIVPAGHDVHVDYKIEGGEIVVTNTVFTAVEAPAAPQPYQRLYYIPGPDENTPDHGEMKIRYYVEDYAKNPVPDGLQRGESFGEITVILASIYDDPRLELNTDEIWYLYEDVPTGFPIQMWTPELYKDLKLTRTSYEYDDAFWNEWSQNGDEKIDVSRLSPHRSVVRSENIRLLAPDDPDDFDAGWRDVQLNPEENQYGELILQLVLDDKTYRPDGTLVTTIRYVKVVVVPVNDPPTVSDDKTETFEDTAITNRPITATDVDGETPTSGLKFRVPSESLGDHLDKNAPAGTNGDIDNLLPQLGTLTVNSNGGAASSWTYTPKKDVHGKDIFYIVVEDTPLTIPIEYDRTYQLEKELSYARIEIDVWSVNTRPTAPEDIETDFTAYKNGESITVSFTPSTETEEFETPDEYMTYAVWVTYDGSNYVLVEDDIPYAVLYDDDSGKLVYTFMPEADKNTDRFRIGITATDDVRGVGKNGSNNPLTSEFGYSGFIRLDNTEPAITHVLEPAVFTNEPVDIVLTVTDLATGSTGIDKVYLVNGGGIVLEEIYDSEGDYPGSVTVSKTVYVNGTYWFKAVDAIGHVSGLHEVQVTKIDKNDPGVTADIEGFTYGTGYDVKGNGAAEKIYADSGAKVALEYGDAEADINYSMSGLVPGPGFEPGLGLRQYILNNDDEDNRPESGDPAWKNYTAPVELDTKGQWYLHAKVRDNAGNEVIETFGPYEINNTPPETVGKEVTVYEHTVGANNKFVDIDIKELVIDPDNPGDIAEIHIISRPDTDYGTWVELWDTASAAPYNEPGFGKYRFTHSGEGRYEFVPVLEVGFSVTDFGDVVNGEQVSPRQTSNVSTITINVVEVNDAPEVPDDAELETINSNPSGGSDLTDGDSVILNWAPFTDEEMDSYTVSPRGLRYEIEVSYDNGRTYEPVEDPDPETAFLTDPGVLTYSFEVPATLTGILYFRIRAVDDGYDAAKDKLLGVEVSDWLVSAPHNLDNDVPKFEASLSTDGFTCDDVVITFTVTEPEEGDTGIKSVTTLYTGGKAGPLERDDSATAVSPDNRIVSETYTFNVEVNGDYEFRVEDEVGNFKVYTVTVENIDKLRPDVNAFIGGVNYDEGFDLDGKHNDVLSAAFIDLNDDGSPDPVYANSGVKVELSYFDEPADPGSDPENNQSGVKDKQYFDIPSATLPENAVWKTYTAPVELKTKGDWYIFARVTDNAGNEQEIRRFGPYQVNNSSPEAPDIAVEIWEHTDATATSDEPNTFEIKLRDYVTDVDGADDITGFVITADPNMAARGTWDGDAETGVCTFTHNGEGNPFIGTFTVKYHAVDSDSNTSKENNGGEDNAIVIKVHEVNDAPSYPAGIAPISGAYRDGQKVELSWTGSTDEETTDASLLEYEIQVSYNGGEWISAGTAAGGDTEFVFTIPEGGHNGTMQFRIRAADDGLRADGLTPFDDDGTKGYSIWVNSPIHKLDNAPPDIVHELDGLNSFGYTKDTLDIVLTVTDTAPGFTGVSEVTYIGDGITAVTPVTIGESDEDTYIFFDVEDNGDYWFRAVDNVGNEIKYKVEVRHIDRLKPGVAVDPSDEEITEEDAVLSNDGRKIELLYSDRDATQTDAKSGVDEMLYVKSNSATPPASDAIGVWQVYEGPVPMDKKGTWYIHAKVTDKAGNESEQIETFGPYVILNNDPKTKDFTVEVWEHDTAEGASSIVIDLFADNRAWDPDDQPGLRDITAFEINADNAAEHGEWKALWDTDLQEDDQALEPDFGKFSFEHDGDGKEPFTDELFVTFVAIDSEGNRSDDETNGVPSTITIKVHEVNDAPLPPTITGPASGSFRDGDTVALRWTAGSDEETPQDELVYEIDVSYDGGKTWNTIYQTAAAATSYDYVIPAAVPKHNGFIQFRVRAVDDGLGAGRDNVLGVMKSVENSTVQFKLDNTPPGIGHVLEPAGYTNGAVVIVLTVTDTGDGATGVKSVTSPSGTAMSASAADGKYRFTASANGSYTFKAADNVGNETAYTVTVDKIDRLAPGVTADTDAGTFRSETDVSLTYTDADGSGSNDATSGVSVARYALVKNDSSRPADGSAAWKEYGSGPVTLDEKGSWYLHALVEDAAGNVAYKNFGLYFMNIDGPVALTGRSVTVSEEDIPTTGGKENEVVIDLNDYVDYDGADKDELVFTVTPSATLTAHGTLTRLSEGVYRFVHNGNGKPFIENLTFTFSAQDTDSVTSDTVTFTIKVTEVNDMPTAPSGLTVSSNVFKDGDEAVLTWLASTDEETAQGDITYYIEASYDSGNTWSPAVSGSIKGSTAAVCTIAGGGKDCTVVFRLQAQDTPIPAEPGVSNKTGWVLVGPMIVDNTKPESDTIFEIRGEPYTLGDEAWEEVDMTIGFSDEGGSGLKQCGYALTLDPAAPKDVYSRPDYNAYTMLSKPAGNVITCPGIGEFFLHLYAVDNAGNEYFKTVNESFESKPIDVLNTRPVAKPQTHTITRGSTIKITLEGYDNDPGDSITAYTIERDVLFGTLTVSPDDERVFTYTNNNIAYVQNDSFRFTVTDESGIKSYEASVSINITAPGSSSSDPTPPPTPPPGNEMPPADSPNNPSPAETPNPPSGGADDDASGEDEDDLFDGDTGDGGFGGQGGGADYGDGSSLLPTDPVSGVSVSNYGKGSLILVVQSAEDGTAHQKSMVTLNEPHAAIVSILSKEELEQVLNGARIEVRVSVEYVRQESILEDKILIENAIDHFSNEIPGLTLGEYLDIKVEYRFEGKPWNNVTQTDGEIELCVDISKSLRKDNASAYYILRSHDGKVTLLYDLDDNPGTITFKTDCFSTYAKTFTQRAPGKAPCPLCGRCREPLGICANIWLLAFLTISATMVYTSVRNRRYPGLVTELLSSTDLL